ncbi:MAG: hypothetical protein M0R03_08915 [Novosphingobium sp.]|nr:hypothetical protein [Novosphingobium sp.]
MLNIVIIGQNEGVSIKSMYDSLQHIECNRIWILDRCTDNSEEQLKELGERYVNTFNSLEGRQTSYCRNLGLMLCDNNSDVLFLDGDRYVKNGCFNNLLKWKNDIALLMVEKDERCEIDDYSHFYGQVNNGFYSCGIFIKREAINKILDFNKGELFSTDIQKTWGIEDTYLGDVCYHLGLTCDLYKDCILNGEFKKIKIDLDTIESRFKKRDSLNVKW